MEYKKIELWIQEIKRYNHLLHLVGSKTTPSIETLIWDCMPLLSSIKEPAIADLGSGSGLPGILYKILNPNAHVSLIERSHNKCTFLQHIVDLLGLEHIEIIESDVTKKKAGPFNAVMTRAFSPKSMLEKALLNTLVPKGLFYSIGTHPPLTGNRFTVKQTALRQERLHLYIYELSL